MGISNIDFLKIPINEKSLFLCFESGVKGPWDAIRKELEEKKRKEEEKNGEIEVLNDVDGLFVTIKPPGVRGVPISLEDAKEKLKEFNYNESILKDIIEKKEAKPVKIGERQYIPELDGKITIRANEKEAYISLTPPHPILGKPIKPGVFIMEIERNNIKFGIDKKALANFIKNPVYNKEVLIARYKEPKKGPPASYIYRFEEAIEAIEGQILAIKEAPKKGEPGISIFSTEIPGLAGDDFEIIPGINTYLSDDKKILYATKNGEVTWNGNRADVERILRIDEDLKENMEFEGRVIISKNIGERVNVTGDEIFVKGNIEGGVFIVSKGGVEIEGDILGEEKNRVSIKAGGDVIANSASFCDIECGASVIMRTGLLYSNTKAENCVVIGRKGVIMTSKDALPEIFTLPIAIEKGVKGIIGGVISAKNSVNSEAIGSISQEKTEVIVEKGGFISGISTYPKTKITIGDKSLEIRKIIENTTFKEERGTISFFPYSQKEVVLKKRVIEQKKPESPPSILVKTKDEGKRLLGISNIDFLKIPINEKSLFLCFESGVKGPWDAIRKELEEKKRKEEEKNGEIEVLNDVDGLFVTIKPPGVRGVPISLEDAKEKLKEFNYNESILKDIIEKKEAKPVKIGERQYIPELDGKITIRANEKEAYISLTPPHPILGKPIKPGVFIMEIERNNIKFGIDKKALANFIKNPVYNKEVLIARYKEPKKGPHARLVYQFGIKEGKELKKEDILEVIEGQILAIKESPKIGEPGFSIFGKELPGILGDDFEIIPGTNTFLSKDGRILYSQERGEAEWKGLRCDVEKTLRINGDLKEDIDFPGKVIILGNVCKRTSIIAKGDIIVRGQVEMGARLTSPGSIYIDKGIFGKKDEEVNISAGADVVCESADFSNISCGGILLIRIFLDGFAKAKRVFIQGRRGVIMTKGEVPPPIFTLPVVIAKGKKTFEGGKILADELVDCEEMGSPEMVETEIEVGENGVVSISGTIFPNSRIKIGRQVLRITKPLMALSFKIKDGRIKEAPYEPTPIEMTKKEIIPGKKMKVEPPASIVITGKNLLEAISEGARFLKIPEERLEFSLLLEERPNKTIRLYPVGMFGPWSEDWDVTYGEDKDGSFSFDNRADGLYLIIHPPYGEGKPVNHQDVLEGIKKEGFREIDYEPIKVLFKEIEEKKERKEHAIKIGPRQYLSDVSTIIKIKTREDGGLDAIFYPPVVGGMLIDIQEIMKYLESCGIKEGIDQRAIKEALVEGRFKEPILIASPIPPKPGKDAFLEYKVKPKSGITLLEDSSGNIDFKELGKIVSVKKGDVLVIKHPLIEGSPGKKITGEEIPPPPVRDIPLPIGRNTKISDDGLSLIADIDGMVVFKEKKIDIEPLYEVKGDVCLLTGNIHFPGGVIVSGSVQEGFIVEAGGDIFIKGQIEGGIVKGSGRIEVKGGVRRGDVSGKEISCSFIENSNIKADSLEVKEQVLFSSLFSLNIKAKKIIGGRVFAKDRISADEIGSKGGTKTLLYLGRNPEIITEIEGLTKALFEKKGLLERLLLDIKHIDMLSSNRKELVKEKMVKEKRETEEIIKRIRGLENMEINEDCGVFVKNRVYPGVEVNILNSHFCLLEEKGPSIFKFSKGRVVIRTQG